MDIKKLCFGVIGLVLTFGQSADAENAPVRYAKDQRFAVMDTGNTDGTKNVELTPVGVRNVPQFIVYQARLIADKCTDSVNNMNSVVYYAYTSDYNRKNKFPPNYILDMKAWKNAKTKACFTSPACEDGRCSLIGFTAQGSDKWSRSFDIKPIEWKTSRQTNPDKSVETLIQITTVDPNCQLSGGKLSTTSKDKTCAITYGWQPKGLASRSQGR